MSKQHRILKKGVIILILIFTIAIILFLIQRYKMDPCYNGRLDTGEQGIDCGGVCAKKCRLTQEDILENNIVINQVTFTEDAPNEYDLLASITNKNEEWGAEKIKYVFTLYNADNQIIDIVENKSYIMPAGRTAQKNKQFIVENNIRIKQKPSRVEFNILEYDWKQIEEQDINELYNGVVQIYNNTFWYDNNKKVYIGRAETKNTSKYAFFQVDIGVALFDKSNQIIAIAKTDQLTMASKNGWGFEVVWPNLKIDQYNIDRLEVTAYTNTLDKQNYVEEYYLK